MPDLITIGDDFIKVIPDKRAALMACVKVSGLPLKAVAHSLEIDYSHLTKMLSPAHDPRHFPQEKELTLYDVCRNEIPLSWLLMRRGYPSVQDIVAMLAEIEHLRAEVARLRSETKGITNVFKYIGE